MLDLHKALTEMIEDSLKIYEEKGSSINSNTMQLIDSLINKKYIQMNTASTDKNTGDAFAELIQLKQIRESLDSKLKSSQYLDRTKHDSYRKIKEQMPKLYANLEKRKNSLLKSLEKPKEKTKAREEALFDINSIITQVIQASTQTEGSLPVLIDGDNKTFEDRKAFMNRPLNNAKIKKRYSQSSAQIVLVSAENNVSNVCKGKVIYSKKLGGSAHTVIIQHDNGYYSVYANLEKTYVSYGDLIPYKYILGTAKENTSSEYELVFQIRQKAKSLNPIYWLKNG